MGGNQSTPSAQPTLSNVEKRNQLRNQLHFDIYENLKSNPKAALKLLQDENQNALINPNRMIGESKKTFLSQIASVYNDWNKDTYKECVRLLIAKNADVNLANQDGNTPLHISVCEPEKAPLTKLLLENGANVNCKNNYGRTPLHIAVSVSMIVTFEPNNPSSFVDEFTKTNKNNVLLLLEHGAKVNEKDNDNFTALELAHSEFTELLKDASKRIPQEPLVLENKPKLAYLVNTDAYADPKKLEKQQTAQKGEEAEEETNEKGLEKGIGSITFTN